MNDPNDPWKFWDQMGPWTGIKWVYNEKEGSSAGQCGALWPEGRAYTAQCRRRNPWCVYDSGHCAGSSGPSLNITVPRGVQCTVTGCLSTGGSHRLHHVSPASWQQVLRGSSILTELVCRQTKWCNSTIYVAIPKWRHKTCIDLSAEKKFLPNSSFFELSKF